MARRVVQEIKNCGHHHNAYSFNTLMFAHACAADAEGARNVFIELRNAEQTSTMLDAEDTVFQDHVAWNTLLIAHANARDAEGAKGVVREICKAEIRPHNTTVNYLFKLLFAHNLEAVKELVHEFPATGWQPDQNVFRTLLDMYSESGDVESVNDVIVWFGEAGYSLTQVVYNKLLKAHAVRGDVTGLTNALASMEETPDLETFNTLLQCYITAGDEISAKEVLEDIQKAGYQPDHTTLKLLQILSGTKGGQHAVSLLHETGHQLDKKVTDMLLKAYSLKDHPSQRLWVKKMVLAERIHTGSGTNTQSTRCFLLLSVLDTWKNLGL